jgi:hypothetical protein
MTKAVAQAEGLGERWSLERWSVRADRKQLGVLEE